MQADEFERKLLELMEREPFRPFVITFHDGSRHEIRSRKGLAFRGGAAGFTPPWTGRIFFRCQEVSQISEDAVSDGVPAST